MSENSAKQKIIDLLTLNKSKEEKEYAEYTPSYKTHYAKLKAEPNKKVISFSVYGTKTVYLIGAEKNIDVASKVYPDWTCRFYCDKNISNLDKLKALAEEGKCEVVVVDSPIFQMYWRYFAADDPNVSAVIFRDTDSLVNYREKSAVEEWLASDKVMHTMHDNDAGHWSPVMGGMCGLKLPLNFKMHEEIDLWAKNLRNYSFAYSDDQSFLSKKVLPLFENSLIDHHNNPSKSKFKNSVPYPNHEDIGYGNFVGDRISAFGFKKKELSQINSKNIFLACHLGPTDHYAVRDAIQAVVNHYDRVVIPIKKHSELLVNYMFGGYESVTIETVNSDEAAFDLYQSKYASYKLIGFGMHGEHIPGMSWGVQASFKQANLPFASNIFEAKMNPNLDYSSLSENYKKTLQHKKPKDKNPLLTSTASLKLENLNQNPKVSVVIPTFNRFKYLLNAIDSVKNQTYKNLEIIVVNDKSTEKDYYNFDFKGSFGDNLNIIHCPKNSRAMFGNVCGGGHARNIGMMFSEGDYIAFLDDDDSFLPNKIEFQLKTLERLKLKMSCTEALYGSGPIQPGKTYKNWHYNGVFWGSIKSIYSNQNNFIDEMFSSEINIWNKKHIDVHNTTCGGSSIMIHKSLINPTGYFKIMGQGEDWDYWKRLSEHTDCAYIREPLSYIDASHGDGRHWA